jgi:RES domain-containing protein
MAHSRPDQLRVADVAFRYSNYDTPLWARANTLDGRWHAARASPTQYFGLSSDACWADLIRHENLRTEPEVSMVRMPLWALKLSEERIADYSTFEKAERAGFAPDALIDDDWERCQAEAERLRGLGYRGVMAPSAALPGALALTLFGGRRAVDWDDDPVVASAIPAKVLTVGGPPPGLTARVRYFGTDHSGYVAYAVERGRGERGR